MSANYVNIAGGEAYSFTVNPATLNVQNNQFRLICKTAGGAITITLPPISDFGSGIDAKIFIEDADDMAATNNIIIILGSEDNTIANSSSYVIDSNGGKIEVYISSFTEYGVLSENTSSGVSSYTWNTGIEGVIHLPYPQATYESLTIGGLSSIISRVLGLNVLTELPSYVLEMTLPDLESIYAEEFYIEGGQIITPISSMLPKLKDIYVEAFYIYDSLDSVISFPKLESINGIDEVEITIDNCINLTSLSYPLLTTIFSGDEGELEISNCPLLTTISTPVLVDIPSEMEFSLNDLPSLTSLAWAEYLADNTTPTSMLGLDFNTLDAVSNATWQSFISSISSAKFQYLELSFYNILLLETINSGAATIFGNLRANSCPALTSVSIASVASNQIIEIVSNPLLTSLVVSASLTTEYFNASGCALNLASVDNALASLDASGAINGYADFSGGTNTSPTGGAANVNKVSLEGKGWTVNIN